MFDLIYMNVSNQVIKYYLNSIQILVGWDFEQPVLEGNVPAYSRGLEIDELKGPFQHTPSYDSRVQKISECML